MKFQLCRFLAFLLLLWALCAQAGQLTPVVAYITDSQGNPSVGTNVTLSAWPATNAITGVGTNLVANVAITEATGAGGFISNNLAPGNYRLQIAGFTHGILFGVVSNGTALNIAQLAGVPVPEFLNFTLAQFSDAGTMAYESTNNWTRDNYLAVSNAVGFDLATNGGPVAVAQLPFTPATNTYSAFTNILGFLPATNGGVVAATQLPYTPATNTYSALTNILGFVPATNGGAISVAQLSTNVLTTFAAGPVSFTTNFGVVWAVFQTNGVLGNTLTNLPSGSICTTTGGQFFVLSNATWLIK